MASGLKLIAIASHLLAQASLVHEDVLRRLEHLDRAQLESR